MYEPSFGNRALDVMYNDNWSSIELGIGVASGAYSQNLYDIVTVTGRSGFILTPSLDQAQLPWVELRPLRVKVVEDGGRPDEPTGPQALEQAIRGKRVILLDDQIGGGKTLCYARAVVRELGGIFIGADFYRRKDGDQPTRWLQPNEIDLRTLQPGLGTEAVHMSGWTSIELIAQERRCAQK